MILELCWYLIVYANHFLYYNLLWHIFSMDHDDIDKTGCTIWEN